MPSNEAVVGVTCPVTSQPFLPSPTLRLQNQHDQNENAPTTNTMLSLALSSTQPARPAYYSGPFLHALQHQNYDDQRTFVPFCTSKGSQLSTCVGPRERPCQPVLSVHCPTTRLRVRPSYYHLVSWSHSRQAVTPLRPFFPPVACYRPRLTEGTRHRGPVLVGAHELLRSFSRCWEESRSRTG